MTRVGHIEQLSLYLDVSLFVCAYKYTDLEKGGRREDEKEEEEQYYCAAILAANLIYF